MTDIQVLADFFMVDGVAARMGWIVNPESAVACIRNLQTLARDETTHPDDIARTIKELQIAIGGINLVDVMGHDLWEDWCPQPASVDPLQYDNGSGIVVWAGKRGYVKTAGEIDVESNINPTVSLHSVRV